MKKSKPFPLLSAKNHFMALAALVSFFALRAAAQTTNGLSEAEQQGRAFVVQILAEQPAAGFTNAGVLHVQDGDGDHSATPIMCKTLVTTAGWQTIYQASWSNKVENLWVVHAAEQPNAYAHDIYHLLNGIPLSGPLLAGPKKFSDAQVSIPFAGSDFSLGDLGLEFFHWPGQKILRKELHRTRGCTVLESTNPHPSPNGYSRVVSWIDNETFGIVEAYAYDVNGKKLKDFYPKDFKKVNGQWQVQTLVMENVQTGSRSRLEFYLKK